MCLALRAVSREPEEELLFGVKVLKSLGVICLSPCSNAAPGSGGGRTVYASGLGRGPSGSHATGWPAVTALRWPGAGPGRAAQACV